MSRIRSLAKVPMLVIRFRLLISAVFLSRPNIARKDLHVRKSSLRQEQEVFDVPAMETDPEKLVARAAGWAEALWNKVYLGLGDTQEAAMHRAEQRYGVPAQTFWALRYRRPKDMMVSVYMRLAIAYNAECERQEAKLAHELEITKRLAPSAARLALVAETETLLGPASEVEPNIIDDDEPTWSSD